MTRNRGRLLTEQRNPRSRNIDAASTADAFDIIAAEDASIAAAVASAKPDICAAIDRVAHAFRRGGRLIYVGAGTSGRLGVLDATECPPTFLSDPAMVQGVIAGGDAALRRSIEGAEDDRDAGAKVIDDARVNEKDVVFGIATGGTTPYVHAAIARARSLGAETIFFACVPKDQVPDDADISIRVLTGPEVITGSTRMKAGTATKMTLNMITTISMIRVGKVYENLMVDLNARACDKLWDRATRIVTELTDLDPSAAESLLESAGGGAKTAIVMHMRQLPIGAAHDLLAAHGGSVRAALAASE